MSRIIVAKAQPLGWIKGTIDHFRFKAKVFDEDSKFGINEGRVSKLTVWDISGEIINYDRGWDKIPANDNYQEMLEDLLEYLEALPKGEDCE